MRRYIQVFWIFGTYVRIREDERVSIPALPCLCIGSQTPCYGRAIIDRALGNALLRLTHDLKVEGYCYMRLERANVENYRSVKDSGWFDVSHDKTILVGPNEAGKTAILKALKHVSPGPLVKPFDPLRDYPRSQYNEFRSSGADPDTIRVASATFTLDPDDQAAVAEIAPAFKDCKYQLWVTLGGLGETR